MKKVLVLLLLLNLSTMLSEANGLSWSKILDQNSQVSDLINSTPAIGEDGTIYVSTYTKLCAVSTSGKIVWTFSTSSFNHSPVSVGKNGDVYVGSGYFENEMLAISKNGEYKWKLTTEDQVLNSPSIGQDGTLYVIDKSGNLYAVSPEGKVLWKRFIYYGGESEPVIGADGSIYVKSDYGLFRYDIEGNETEIGKYYSQNGKVPIIDKNGVFYMGGINSSFCAINPNGSLKWSYPESFFGGEAAAIDAEGNIYFADWGSPGSIYKLSVDGKLVWKFSAPGLIDSNPAIDSNGNIYFTVEGKWDVANDDYLYCVTKNGVLSWSYEVSAGGSSPMISNTGMLYLGSANGYLYAFNIDATGLANSMWPCYGGSARRSFNVNYEDDNAPVSIFTADSLSGKIPFTVNFQDKSEGLITSWLWEFGDGSTSVQENPTHIYKTSGQYKVSLTVFNEKQSNKTFKYNFIEAYDPVNIDAKMKFPGGGKIPVTIQFVDESLGNNISGYFWDFGDGTVSNQKNPSHKFTKAGNFEVLHVVSNGLDIDSVTNTVKTFDVKLVKDKLSGSGKPLLCQDGSICSVIWKGLVSYTKEGTVLWTYNTSSAIEATPVQANNGMIYFTTNDYYLNVLTPDGKLKWKYQLGGFYYSSPALGIDGTAYIGDENRAYAIDSTGKSKWVKYLLAEFRNSPLIGLDGSIYLTSQRDGLFALSPDGQKKWNYDLNPGANSSPAMGTDSTIYFGSFDHNLYAIKPDGSLKWKCEIGYCNESSPVIGSDGTIYIGGGFSIFAVNPNGTIKWSYKTEDNVVSSAVLSADGSIYIGSTDGYFYCFNTDGTLNWKYSSDPVSESATIDENGVVYQVCSNYPSADLYAFITGNGGMENSIWPSYKGNIRNTANVFTVIPDFKVEVDSGIVPFTAIFDNLTTGYSNSFKWDFGDGTISTEKSPSHKYTQSGNYTVKLTSVLNGKEYTIQKKNFIAVLPDVITPDFETQFLSGSQPFTANFINKTTGSVDNWLWDFGDGKNSTEKNPTHVYQKYGIYTIKLTASDEFETQSKTREKYISVTLSDDLIPDFSADTTSGFMPLTIHFNDSSSGTIENWLWNFGDGNTSMDQNPVHTYPDAGFYSVSLTISNPFFSRQKTVNRFIQVIDPENLIAGIATDTSEGVEPMLVNFSDKSTGNVDNWFWDFGNGDTSTLRNPVYEFKEAGVHRVTLVISNELYCDTAFTDLIVNKSYLWKLKFKGDAFYTPAVDKRGVIYVGDENKNFYAINSVGDILWQLELECPFKNVAINNQGNIIVSDSCKKIYLFSPDGMLLWKNNYTSSLSALAVGDSQIYFTTQNKEFNSLTLGGEQLWSFSPREINSSPLIDIKGNIFACNENYMIYIFNQLGEYVKTIQFPNYKFDELTVAFDSIIYASTNKKQIKKINSNSEKLIWSYSAMNTIPSRPVIGENGTVYFVDVTGVLYALSSNGILLWKYITKNSIYDSPLIGADGSIYVTNNSGTLFSINQSGKLNWKFQSLIGKSVSPLLLNDGTLILAGTDSSLYALSTQSCGLARSDWPAMYANSQNTSAVEPIKSFQAKFYSENRIGKIPLSVEFYDASFGKVDQWFWDFGDGQTSIDKNPVHEYINDGNFSVKLKIKCGEQTDSLFFTDYVKVFPNNILVDFQSSKLVGKPPLTVNFLNLTTGSIENWLWNFGDGFTSIEENPAHTYTDLGKYSVTLNADGYGDVDTLIKKEYITVEFPAGILDQLNSTKLLVYPNPTNGLVYVKGLTENHFINLEVYDLNGRLMLFDSKFNSNSTVDLSGFPTGAYMLILNDYHNGALKLIKQ